MLLHKHAALSTVVCMRGPDGLQCSDILATRCNLPSMPCMQPYLPNLRAEAGYFT